MSYFRYGPEATEEIRKKIKIYLILVVFCFLCLWLRVWYLQILKGGYFIELSENNRVRMVSLSAFRGTMKDRNGEVLVGIRPSFNLYITPEDADDLPATFGLLKTKVDFDEDKVRAAMKQAKSFKPVLIQADILREQVAFIEENKMRLPGVGIKVEPTRNYVYPELASHVMGYVGEITRSQLDQMQGGGYQQGDLTGKEGLESLYEQVLRGQKGFKEVEVDVSGRELRVLRKRDPLSGDNLVLTLDARIQKTLETLMTGTPDTPVSGSAVMMKVQTGEILAIASKPSFDGNLFATGISQENWNALINDERHPLQNRVVGGQYPPGSTYKIVTALAGLEEGVITPETEVYCPGHFRLGRGLYRCWKRGGHGTVNLHDAIVQSCDVFFYTIGNQLGIDTLAKYASLLGLGRPTGVELSGERPGLIPTTQWKMRKKREAWLAGETISASIGQGFNLVTPMQQVAMTAAVANGGILLKPHLIKRIEEVDGRLQKIIDPEILGRVNARPENLEFIRDALRDVVNGKSGTGRAARMDDIVVSGKTGTAQVVHLRVTEDTANEDEIPYQFRDHAWFVAFAPYEKPEIAVAVLVEHGGHGGSAAAPLAKKLMQAYFTYYPTNQLTVRVGPPQTPTGAPAPPSISPATPASERMAGVAAPMAPGGDEAD
jgi:penicillin-binding protein 2